MGVRLPPSAQAGSSDLADGIDTESGKHRPRQLGTYASRRSAQRAASAFTESGDVGSDHGTVGALVDSWVAGRVYVSAKSRMQTSGRRRRSDAISGRFVSTASPARTWPVGWRAWRPAVTSPGAASSSSERSCAPRWPTPSTGELRRSPADRVGMPHVVAKPDRDDEIKAWTEEEAQQFLRSIAGHRWAGPIRLALLYGLRRSELLDLSWSAVDLKKGTVRIERGLIEVHGRPVWSDGKNARSRRTFSIDPSTTKALAAHRRFQAEEQLAAGTTWVDNNLVVASKTGTPVSPGNFDQTLERLVAKAGVPRLTSHGLRAVDPDRDRQDRPASRRHICLAHRRLLV